MTAVLKKPVLVNPIQQAFEDYAILQNENEILKHSEIQLKDMNVGLLQENKILNERLRDVEADRDAAVVPFDHRALDDAGLPQHQGAG